MDPLQREQRIQTVCLLAITIVVVAVSLRWLQPIMIPLVLAVFFSFALSALVDWLVQRWRFPRPLALIFTLLLAALAFTVAVGLISTSIRQLAANADVYQNYISRLSARGVDALPLEKLGLRREDVLKPLNQMSLQSVGSMLLGTANTLMTLLSQSFLVMIFLIFLMIGRPANRAKLRGVWAEAERRVKRYLLTKAAISAATGFLVGLVLWLLDVDLAVVFGLFAFLLNFIPNLGSIIATLLPLPVLLANTNVSTTTAVLAILIPGAIQMTIGNILEPRIMGQKLDLHPITILIALIFWGMLWGLPGMFLGVPITVVLAILCARLEHTRPAAHLLAGRLDLLFGEDASE